MLKEFFAETIEVLKLLEGGDQEPMKQASRILSPVAPSEEKVGVINNLWLKALYVVSYKYINAKILKGATEKDFEEIGRLNDNILILKMIFWSEVRETLGLFDDPLAIRERLIVVKLPRDLPKKTGVLILSVARDAATQEDDDGDSDFPGYGKIHEV